MSVGRFPSSEGQGAHPRTDSQLDAAATPEATLPGPESTTASVRCEACELEAARLAYAADLGASEWAAFIDRVPPCDGCRAVAVVRGERPAARCDCGKTEIVSVAPGVTVTKLRCPFCPPERARPTLTLVKP